MSTSKDKPQHTGAGSTGGGTTAGGGSGGGRPGGGTQPGGGEHGTGSTGGGRPGGTQPGGATGPGGGEGRPKDEQTRDEKKALPKTVEFTSVYIKDDSDAGEGEVYFKFTVNDLPPQYSGRLDVSDDEKVPVRKLHLQPFRIPEKPKGPATPEKPKGAAKRQVKITVEGREDDTPGYADPFRDDAKHYDKLGTASVIINEGDLWKPGENEVSADSGKFRVKYRLL